MQAAVDGAAGLADVSTASTHPLVPAQSVRGPSAARASLDELPPRGDDRTHEQPGETVASSSLELSSAPGRSATSPDPAPVASTSSSPASPSPSALASPSPTGVPTPPAKKVVLLRRPASPANPAAIDSTIVPEPAAAVRVPRTAPEDVEELARRASRLTMSSRPSVPARAASVEPSDAPSDGRLDPVLHAALNHPRDRILLLRAEVEMERFVGNPSMSRLPLAPPHFQPGLNSYQRLLIHRLADMFGITREVEAAPPALWNAGMINPATGQPQGVVVLVKSEASAPPPTKLAILVPAPEPVSTASPLPASPSVPVAPSTPSPAPSTDSPAPSTSSTPAPAAPPAPQPVFKILPRASASRAVSSAASSIAGEEDGSSSAGTGSGKGKGRRDLTLEEREAAYKEARERIFNQPDVERSAPAPPSAASSVAGEDTASVQSLGYGITRPSSAGSTFSRSSAALSVSGQRPPPSLASDSSAAMKPGIATFYQTPQAMYGGMRPPPSFDPTTGTWTYSQAPAPEYPYYQPHFSGPSPPASAYPYASPSPYTPPPQPMFEASPPVAPHAAWSRGLPSPALSSSSGGSLQHPFPPFHAPPAATPPAPASIASTAGSSDAGYLMRFPEGAVVTPGGSVVGPPAPYATVAGSASLRSMSSASVGSSASRIARAGSAVGASSMRRLSQSTTHSLGSVSAFSSSADAASRKSPSATGDSPETSQGGRSDAGSSTGGSESAASAGADARKRGRQTTIVGGRPGSDSAERDDGEGYEDGLIKTPSSLHPSLPAKPSWVAAAAQAERPPLAKASSGSGPVRNGQSASPQQHILLPSPPPPPPVGAAQPKLPPYPAPLSSGIAPPPSFFASQQPYGGPSAYPGLPQVNAPPAPPPISPANGAPWLRSSAPVSPYGTAPSDFPPLGGAQPFYPTPPPSLPPHGYPPAWQSHAAAGAPPAHPGLAHAPTQQAFNAGSPAPAPDDLMTMPDMRRPPPRSTQLFDPNKPLAQQQGAGVAGGGMRRGGSAAGRTRA
ncbi:uncharacterized protein JCM10292_006204 [Rhodotorula paludigena]|uniref:uncharacterized protein n=1 Tax=Rhodotorula paludigena TaxID=86838 RepID=UPI0031763C1A